MVALQEKDIKIFEQVKRAAMKIISNIRDLLYLPTGEKWRERFGINMTIEERCGKRLKKSASKRDIKSRFPYRSIDEWNSLDQTVNAKKYTWISD